MKTLPNGKLPDRKDCMSYDRDLAGRVKVWKTAASAAQQLADEFAQWLNRPEITRIQAF